MASGERWFEQEAFWRDMDRKIYGEAQRLSAQHEVNAAVSLLAISPASRVLDMCCGNGRHSIELAKLGHEVTAVDLNAAYLATGRNRAEEEGVGVNFQQGDMRTYARADSFDAALVMWNAFGYFETDEEDVMALTALCATLRPGGKLLIQTHGRESTARKFVRKDWFEIGNQLVLDQRWIENDWASMRTRYIIVDDHGRRDHTMSCRLYSPKELSDLMHLGGFSIVRTYGNLSGAPYDERATELVAVATKPH